MKDIELGLKSPVEKLSFYSVSCSQLKKVKVSDLVVLWLSSRVKKFRIFRRIFELTREKRSQRSQYGSSSKAKFFSRDGFSLQAGKRQNGVKWTFSSGPLGFVSAEGYGN